MDDRDNHGRFVKGHKSPGPGRKPNSAYIYEHTHTFVTTLTKAHVKQLILAIWQDALNAQNVTLKLHARDFLAKLLIRFPEESVELATQQKDAMLQQLQETYGSIPPP